MKALRSSAALMMRTATAATAWVAKYKAAAERLKLREVAAKAGASA
jgi:hypothetical protein